MPKRRKIDQLPSEVKTWLDQALVKGAFGEFEALSAELTKRGYSISKSAIGTYSQEFQVRLEKLRFATEQAKAVVNAAPDDEDAMSQALTRLAQEKIFNALKDMPVDPSKLNLGTLTRSVAELARSSTATKKWAVEVRSKLDAKLAALEGEKTAAGKPRFDTDTLRHVREVLYGIVS